MTNVVYDKFKSAIYKYVENHLKSKYQPCYSVDDHLFITYLEDFEFVFYISYTNLIYLNKFNDDPENKIFKIHFYYVKKEIKNVNDLIKKSLLLIKF